MNRQQQGRRRRATLPTVAVLLVLGVSTSTYSTHHHGCSVLLPRVVQGFVVPTPRSTTTTGRRRANFRGYCRNYSRNNLHPCQTLRAFAPSPPRTKWLPSPLSPPPHGRGTGTTSLFVSTDAGTRPPSTADDGDDDDGDAMDDETLLTTVTLPFLQGLCGQMNLTTTGTKEELLVRLRNHADTQARVEGERRRRLAREIEAGVDEEGYPTKHRLVDGGNVIDVGYGGDDDGEMEEEEALFYFESPGNITAPSREVTVTDVTNADDRNSDDSSSGNPVTVPPPPPDVGGPNADNGERVVTVYSTRDDNDMTGMNTESIMGEPGREGMEGGYSRGAGATTTGVGVPTADGAGGSHPEDTLAGGPFGDTSGVQRRRADERDLDEATEAVTELVQGLLAMTGAPGFQDEFAGGLQPLAGEDGGEDDDVDLGGENVDLGIRRSVVTSSQPQLEFVGFDPTNVPTDMLTAASSHLRAGGGQALRSVLSDFEIQAVGHDGMAADDATKGGGHYREVRKVGAFLEGYRRAEVRRVARETASLLLDKLVTDGVRGLDLLLATTGRGGDDGAGSPGELNDSLLEYLNGAIRQQEAKVEQLRGTQEMQHERRMGRRPTEGSIRREREEDATLSGLWNVTQDERGQITESIDPKDPNVQRAVQRELERAKSSDANHEEGPSSQGGAFDYSPGSSSMPTTAPEQLLLLLTCLRDRVKAEAAFSTDEKGRNLRVLAYVLHAKDDREREGIITKELGSSLDRLDSFTQLLTSAIDYAESTSHRLQPSRGAPLNVAALKNIKSLVEDINERQAWKASGISTRDNKYDRRK